MPAPRKFVFRFRSVIAASGGSAFLVGTSDISEEQDLGVSYLFCWDGRWRSSSFRGAAIGLCATERQSSILIADADGIVFHWENDIITPVAVDAGPDGPDTLGPVREIRWIAGMAYLVGMGRTVYRSQDGTGWDRIDMDVRCADLDPDLELEDKLTEDLYGFESIDGFSSQEIYAAGWNGELWHYNGVEWRKIVSPTNLAIYSIICAPDVAVYAVGQAGIVLKGRHDQWRILIADHTSRDFWDATWFLGHLYILAGDGLYRMVGDVLEAVELEFSEMPLTSKKSPIALSSVDANRETIWVAGKKTIAKSTDGKKWTELPYGNLSASRTTSNEKRD